MHVVIGGYGRVGRYLAHELESQGHTIAVIDRNPDVYEEFEGINGLRLNGEVFDRDTMMTSSTAMASEMYHARCKNAEPAIESTRMISPVAYATDEMASDENTASAIGFESLW